MNFEEFRRKTLKLDQKRNHKIKNSFGIRGVYKLCKKENLLDKVPEKDFYLVVRAMNKALANELLNGNEVTLPQRMGKLEIRKWETYVKFVDGKLHTNRGIDWYRTLKLWNEDEEAKNNKTLLKVEDKENFTVFYNRLIANYNNKTIFSFKPNRDLKNAVNKAGKDGLIDSFKIGR